MIEKFLEALDEDKEYDFIANHYNSMSKFDLRTILLEYIGAVHDKNMGMCRDMTVSEIVQENLEEATCNL